jgi:hypothetical protein
MQAHHGVCSNVPHSFLLREGDPPAVALLRSARGRRLGYGTFPPGLYRAQVEQLLEHQLRL